MLNIIWGCMLLIGIVYGFLSGNIDAVSNALLEYAESAVTLCITMAGIMALWVGLMEIATSAGILKKLTQLLRPVIRFLFPDIPDDHPSMDYIATNIATNIMGLGWACTPAGLKAMKELANLEAERSNPEYVNASGDRQASNEMCNFLILNISSLQLIPVNMIAYRSQYGSANPASIIAPAIAATLFSSLVAVVFCKWKDRGGIK